MKILKAIQPKRKITILLLFPLFLFSICACDVRPLITLTATSTPTQTNTATNTPIKTLTPSPINTLLPTEILAATITPNPDLIKEFAGIYRKADDTSENSLEIGRDSTFKLECQSKVNGVLESVSGVVSYSNGQFLLPWTSYSNGKIFLTWPGANDEPSYSYQCFPQALIPIYWGERKYLFGTNANNDDGWFETMVSYFCADVKNGNEPRNSIDDTSWFYFLREADTTIKVTGAPRRLDGQLLCP